MNPHRVKFLKIINDTFDLFTAKPIRAGHTPQQVNHTGPTAIRGGGMQPYQPPAAQRRAAVRD